MKKVKENNITRFYLDDRLLMTVTELGNDKYIVENGVNKIEGICKNIDNHRTLVRIEKHYTVGKNGRLYTSKKLIDHNTRWFAYILQEEGFVPKTLVV